MSPEELASASAALLARWQLIIHGEASMPSSQQGHLSSTEEAEDVSCNLPESLDGMRVEGEGGGHIRAKAKARRKAKEPKPF
jgi:hypothetical protein